MSDAAIAGVRMTSESSGSSTQIAKHGERSGANGTQLILIASTFTADPLCRPLRFWMEALEIVADVHISSYGQVMQELLDPESAFSNNRHGFNVLLIRVEDWIRDRMTESEDINCDHIRRSASDLVAAMSVLTKRASAATLIAICRSSSSLPRVYNQVVKETETSLSRQLADLAKVYCLTHEEVHRLYPVVEWADPSADRLGHIPYTNEHFIAIATLLTRRMAVLVRQKCKVIVIDCDNTLWKGVCGEGAVEVTEELREFQKMLIRQYESGVLLCLCSKNNESDVHEVFKSNSGMLLKEEHFISSRINWESKSSNLRSLSEELDLSLDGFVLIDDSAIECAEVSGRYPAVLTLQFPEKKDEVRHFLDHTWVFDRVNVTEEAKGRTAQYREIKRRSQAQQEAPDLATFLKSLELQVHVEAMRAAQLQRVAELVQRTNQFNTTTIRRTYGEIESLTTTKELEILVVHVRDRFGDYGLVGAVFIRREKSRVEVDSFILSCRVLGRGVEHRIVNELGRLGRLEGRDMIVFRFRPTARNVPARSFLERAFLAFRSELDEKHDSPAQSVYRVPVGYAEGLDIVASARDASVQETQLRAADSDTRLEPRTSWYETAYQLSRVSNIDDAMNASIRRARPGDLVDEAPLSSREKAVARVWAEVLGLNQVSPAADFFDLGGDSLLAVQAIARISSELGFELSVYEFFEGPTVREVAARLGGATRSAHIIESADRTRPLMLSSAQQRLWFIDKLERGSRAYHIPLAIQLTGHLDLGALRAALDRLIARHEALRTVFPDRDGEPVQSVAEGMCFPLAVVDVKDAKNSEQGNALALHSREEFSGRFDIGSGPLIRGRLVQLSENEQVLLVTIHHMVADGWSLGILVRELGELYEAILQGRPPSLPLLPIQYVDYAHWQLQWLHGEEPHEQLRYWSKHLRGAPELLELPADRARPAVQSYRGANARVLIDADLSDALRAASRQHNITIAMTLYAAWAILLGKLSGQEDIVVGMPVANRRHTEFEGVVGFFVNTLAVRLRFGDNPNLEELLQRVKEVMLGAYAHQDLPFEKVVEAVQPPRSLSYAPIFQVMFVLHNTPRGVVHLPGLTIDEREASVETAQFDLTLSLREAESEFVGQLNYATDLFDEETIQRWILRFKLVLRAICSQSQMRVGGLSLLDEAERSRFCEPWFGGHASPYARNECIHELFELQVERSPSAIALTYQEQSLTYQELNARANRLAWCLKERSVEPGDLVAVCVDRSVELVVAILGILKCGAAYVPLDPDYPTERLAYILKDAAPRALLIQKKVRQRLSDTDVEVLSLDEDVGGIEAKDEHNPVRGPSSLRSSLPAYVIYTSGSTGKPKGVMVTHRNVTRLFSATQHWFEFDGRDVWTLFHSVNFDFSVWELWGALLYGGRLVVVPYVTSRSPNEFYQLVRRERVTILNQTPSAFAQLIEAQRLSLDKQHLLRLVIFGGEALELRMLRSWVAQNGAAKPKLINMYGITETTVHVTYRQLAEQEIETERRSPVGTTIPDLRAYILDRYGQPVPTGVTGQLYVAGSGVALGYLRRPELTAERFLPDPFCAHPGARMYATGDLGRWRLDGGIDYFGRNDHQVKIRGFRIELGEIEAQLVSHEGVREAVVIAREDMPGQKRIVAYVLLECSTQERLSPTAESLRVHLKASLPEYMLPSAIVVIQSMPLTENGKLDLRALPPPDISSFSTREYERPEGEVEEMLAGVWQELLGVTRVGRQDNFFELGGHSLLIVQMMDRLRRARLSVEVRSVFESPKLADLARMLTDDRKTQFQVPGNMIPSNCDEITPTMLPLVDLKVEHIEAIARSVRDGTSNIQDIYPLAPLQEGILFHHLLNDQGGDVYVLPLVLCVSSRERLDELIAALQWAIDRHDILRTAVLWDQLPRPVQVVYRAAKLSVTEEEVGLGVDPAEQIERWIKPELQRIDIRNAPPMRMRVCKDVSNGHWYVLLQLHHITIDHLTLETLTAEIVAHLKGHAHELPKSEPYRNHVAQALAYARTNQAEVFFRSKLGDIDESTAPFGLTNIQRDGRDIEEAAVSVERELAQRVRAQARLNSVSSATLFHAAWALVVGCTSGRDDIAFGSVLLGRLQSSAAAQRILGMFINTLPVRLRLAGATAKELVLQTQRELIELIGHEQAPLAVAQRCSGIAPTEPVFTTLFNYRHSAPNFDAQWSSVNGVRSVAIQERTNYPITLSVDDFGEAFILNAQTDRSISARRVAGYLHQAMVGLVEALELDSTRSVLELPILPADEREQVIELFNATHRPYARERLIHELFEDQVERTPDAVALECEGQSLTYAGLNEKASQLARLLRSRGVSGDQLVGLCVERSLEMVVGLLGILKAGGAYLPLDPNYPSERLQYMLEDAAPRVVLSQSRLKAVLLDAPMEVIALDDLLKEDAVGSEEGLSPAELGLAAQNLVYVIYTSGSTGRPKGTAMSHRSMVNLIEWHRQHPHLSKAHRVLQFAALSFDVAFQEVFSTLCTGGSLVLLDEWVRRDARALLQFLSAQSIERLFLPPMMLQSLSECFKGMSASPLSLKEVITAGEQLRITPEIAHFFKHLSGCRLHNHYGPTESHVVTAMTLSGDPADWPALPPIGQPVANTQIYILDRRRQPVPIGVVGGIYIAGANVARGYLSRPELTADRFVGDPFIADPKSRMYRTGDLGRWRADGTIEYLGRDDSQVKVRGYRIELGEIEARLAGHADVREAVVTVREDAPGEKRLVAYVTPRDGATISAEELRSLLKSEVPEYMIPSAFVTLEALPLTPSGKLDRRALPEPGLDAYANEDYEPPQGEMEETIAKIWQELLQVGQIGRQDNFFELGGHSLLAVQFITRIHSAFSVEMPIRLVFTHPTLERVSEVLKDLKRTHLLQRLATGGAEVEELLEKVASLPETEVEVLLSELTMEGRL